MYKGISLALLFVVPLSVGQAENLLPNGGFEEGQGLAPTGWTMPLEQIASWDLRGGRTGRRVVTIGSSHKNGTFWLSDPISIVPGVEYRLTGWIKTFQAEGESTINIGWYRGDGWWTKTSRGKSLKGTNLWTKIEVVDTAPDNARAARIMVGRRKETSKGMSWYDDIVFEPTNPRDVAQSRPRPVPPKWDSVFESRESNTKPVAFPKLANIAPNSMLRDGTDEPTGWSKINPIAAEFKWTKKSSDVDGGLTITNSMLDDAGWISDAIRVRPGTEYTFLARLKLDGAYNVRLAIDWMDSKQKSIGVTLGSDDISRGDWTHSAVAGAAPSQAVFARLILVQQRSSGTATMDKVWFGPMNSVPNR